MVDTNELKIEDSRIPDEITIGENKFKVSETPELLKFMQSVGKVEKAKLYSTIEGLKKQLTESESKINALAQNKTSVPPQEPTINASKIEAKTQGVTKESIKTALESVNSKTELTVENIAETMANMFNSTLENALPAMFEKYVKPIAEKTSLLERETLTQYREKRLAEVGDTVIPEMVVGDSKEEIEKSIEKASQIRSRYRTQQVIPQTPAEQKVAEQQAPPAPPSIPLYPTPEERELNIRGMTDEDFAKNRDSLQSKLKTMTSGYPVING